MTRKDIELLKQEAANAGDFEMVRDCQLALAGNGAAWAVIEQLVDEALAREQEDLAW